MPRTLRALYSLFKTSIKETLKLKNPKGTISLNSKGEGKSVSYSL